MSKPLFKYENFVNLDKNIVTITIFDEVHPATDEQIAQLVSSFTESKFICSTDYIKLSIGFVIYFELIDKPKLMAQFSGIIQNMHIDEIIMFVLSSAVNSTYNEIVKI